MKHGRSLLRQALLCAVLVAATLAVWIAFVPSARSVLDRAGMLDLIGVDIAEARDEPGGPGPFGAGGPTPVVVGEVIAGTMNDRIATIGDGRARRNVDVCSEAAGIVTEVHVAAGDRVEAGHVLVRLDERAEEIAVERARIDVAEARDAVDRAERLQGSGSITAVGARSAELALRAAELDLRQAEIDLSDRQIRAPISGWVGLPEIDVGDRVSPEDVLVTITDRSEVVVEFRVPERVVSQIAVGMPFEATPLALPDLALTGEVSAIDSTIDRASRTLKIQGRLDNERDRLRAGMAFSIGLALAGETYPAVDPLALQWSSEGSFVWSVAEDRAVRVPVLIRERNAASVLVEGDLTPGQPVVIEGVQTLRPGSEVTMVEPARAALETSLDRDAAARNRP